MQTKKLKIIPLGGLGEFGMNCLAIRWEDDIIVIDAGLMFPESELLGVDIVVPDISYLVENKAHVRAIILTHGRGSRFPRRQQGKRLGVGPELLRPVTLKYRDEKTDLSTALEDLLR